jgi:hypothetical protein
VPHTIADAVLQMGEIETAVEKMLEVDEFQLTPAELSVRDTSVGSILYAPQYRIVVSSSEATFRHSVCEGTSPGTLTSGTA